MTGSNTQIQNSAFVKPMATPAKSAVFTQAGATKAAATAVTSQPRAESTANGSDLLVGRLAKQSLAKMQYYRPSAVINTAAAQTVPASAAANNAQAPASQAVTLGASKSGQSAKAGENTGCQTCQERTYQDGSNDSGVSFQTPTHISSAMAGVAVASHEGEHVSRETEKARQEGMIVTEKTVTFQMACCPECHKMYVAGGLTKISTMPENDSTSVTSALAAEGEAGEALDLLL